MSSTLPATGPAGLAPMATIEMRRFARHPLLWVSALVTYAFTAYVAFDLAAYELDGEHYTQSMLSSPIVPAFFLGLPSLIVAARLTRSTDASAEAMGTAPRTEARRSLALAAGCLVPFAAGLVWLVELLVIAQVRPPYEQDLWFPNLDDRYVWSVLIALGPVASLGGALLGVLIGRWIHFRGATAVSIVVLVFAHVAGNGPRWGNEDLSHLVTFWPWTGWHSGDSTDTASDLVPAYTQALLPGNPVTFLLYTLTLCALAVGGAMWHDRSARTPRLRTINLALVAAAVVLYLLTAFTGIPDPIVSGVWPEG